jgi:hypothetical protein
MTDINIMKAMYVLNAMNLMLDWEGPGTENVNTDTLLRIWPRSASESSPWWYR